MGHFFAVNLAVLLVASPGPRSRNWKTHREDRPETLKTGSEEDDGASLCLWPDMGTGWTP